MKKILMLLFAVMLCMVAFAQKSNPDSLLRAKDSTLKTMIHQDSVKIEKQYAESLRWQTLLASE